MSAVLELDDIQSGVLRPRPTPYAATYLLVRIDDHKAGREMLRRVSAAITSAANPVSPEAEAWVSIALTFQGLKALGVPQDSLDSFPPEFQQGMAARAQELGDVGESSPANWEKPLGTSDVHVVLAGLAPDTARLEARVERARKGIEGTPGIEVIYRQDSYVGPTEREHFGFKDSISHPAVEGSGIPGSNPKEQPLKAGEFVLGYPDEMGGLALMPGPEVLGRNGTYVVFRKLHQRVAAFRQYVKSVSSSAEEEELHAAKMVGRWKSGCPLALSPERDDPAIGADSKRNNAFLFHADDPTGLKTPRGSHIRRMNFRDATEVGQVRLHRMIRRGTAYGPPLPEGVLEDDGQDRGLIFAFVGSNLARQFEFVQTEWLNKGDFIGANVEQDPLCSANTTSGMFTLPKIPIRRRLQGLPQFVVTRGGEYCFMPGLRALRWLADLNS
ncbi:MAG: Dyp-type peroxidase [Deltaproteobacteria bacterium]|nr:Dyp-type peroxidase [Deltaproteobacteria bacterium]MBI3386285.1 Dyp-type peroxidase [Deltaproteobacteria bacterium]